MAEKDEEDLDLDVEKKKHQATRQKSSHIVSEIVKHDIPEKKMLFLKTNRRTY